MVGRCIVRRCRCLVCRGFVAGFVTGFWGFIVVVVVVGVGGVILVGGGVVGGGAIGGGGGVVG